MGSKEKEIRGYSKQADLPEECQDSFIRGRSGESLRTSGKLVFVRLHLHDDDEAGTLVGRTRFTRARLAFIRWVYAATARLQGAVWRENASDEKGKFGPWIAYGEANPPGLLRCEIRRSATGVRSAFTRASSKGTTVSRREF